MTIIMDFDRIEECLNNNLIMTDVRIRDNQRNRRCIGSHKGMRASNNIALQDAGLANKCE
jgi:hypothetical protein